MHCLGVLQLQGAQLQRDPNSRRAGEAPVEIARTLRGADHERYVRLGTAVWVTG